MMNGICHGLVWRGPSPARVLLMRCAPWLCSSFCEKRKSPIQAQEGKHTHTPGVSCCVDNCCVGGLCDRMIFSIEGIQSFEPINTRL